jgi:S1-C subfamily serine protease
MGTALPASAQETGEKPAVELPTVTFSNLLFRLDGSNEAFGFFQDDMRVLMLETLRNEGFRGVGAESLVFQRDDSSQADFALGGTMRELDCKKEGARHDCCRVGVDWELLDIVRQEVVYKHRSRYGECHLSTVDADSGGRRLAIGALRALLHRPRFVSELKERKALQDDKPYAPANIARCKPRKIAMTKSSDPAIDATVIVESGKGHGSGFILSSSGFIMTAAHVLHTNEVTVKTRDGVSYRAKPIRISRKFDVALLKADLLKPLADTQCLTLNPEPQRAGVEIYAIGAPASQELGFSLTRGIVSGLRERHGVHHLQTDAPVSPGNSGGPLVDANGRALAVVVSKLAGAATEGIAFGLPIDVATRALGLKLDAKSDPELENAPAQAVASGQTQAFVDPADLQPTPVRTQGTAFKDGPATSRVEKQRDAALGVSVLQGWFYMAPGLELLLLTAPTTAEKSRFSLELRQRPGNDVLEGCRALALIVNGRAYAPTNVKPAILKSSSRELVSGIEGQLELAALKRVREHAPTVTLRACSKSWTLAPSQITAIQKLLNQHETLSGEPL